MFNSAKRRPGQLAASVAAVLCSFVVVSASVASSSVNAWSGDSPVGVWKMQVTFVTCDTGTPFRAPFPALNTFYADGNISEVGSGLGPAFRSVSHGRWGWTEKGTLAVSSEIQLFDSNFIYWASQVYDRRYEISDDGHSMTGKATYVRYGADGSEIFRGCATEEGTRQDWPTGL